MNMQQISHVPMSSHQLIPYLAGLIDGEGWVGVQMERHPNMRSGYNFTPIVRIALHSLEEPALAEIQKELGFGRVVRSNTRPTISLTFTKKSEVLKLLDLIENEVRLPSMKSKISLVKKIISILGFYKHLSDEEVIELKNTMVELRRLSKRTRGQTRIWS